MQLSVFSQVLRGKLAYARHSVTAHTFEKLGVKKVRGTSRKCLIIVALITLLACSDGVILVCTDAAARGLDIPDVSHVVQAEFAASAVDFIHRVRVHTKSFLFGHNIICSLRQIKPACHPA